MFSFNPERISQWASRNQSTCWLPSQQMALDNFTVGFFKWQLNLRAFASKIGAIGAVDPIDARSAGCARWILLCNNVTLSYIFICYFNVYFVKFWWSYIKGCLFCGLGCKFVCDLDSSEWLASSFTTTTNGFTPMGYTFRMDIF